jgi:putative membrane protein
LVVEPLVLQSRPSPELGDRPMIAVWLWTWVSSALAAAVFFRHPAAAGWGAAAMGIAGVPLLRRIRRP